MGAAKNGVRESHLSGLSGIFFAFPFISTMKHEFMSCVPFLQYLEVYSLLRVLCDYLIAFGAQLTAEVKVTAFCCTTLRSAWH